MSIFNNPEFKQHEEVRFIRDEQSGLTAVVAIHSTARGPALGGLRMRPYASEEEALEDVLRLSAGMSYKSSILKLNYGGGKGAIIGDPKTEKTAALLASMGRAVQNFGGRWFTGEDANISLEDAEVMSQQSEFIIGTRGGGGDPAPFTAHGVLMAIKASVAFKSGRESMSGLTVAIQGVGAVGLQLCRKLRAEGANVIVADPHWDRVQKAVSEFGATGVTTEAILSQPADVLAPCAFGAVINDETLSDIQAPIIAGAANNQLAHAKHGDLLHEKGILYVPDYLANSGGLMNIVAEINMRTKNAGYDAAKVLEQVETIYDRSMEIFERSKQLDLPTRQVCDLAAEEWLKGAV